MNQTTEFRIANVSGLSEVVQFVKSIFSGKDILLLNGPMGVGKTEFVRTLVSNLHGERISSPSFAIHNSYSTDLVEIDHLDLFRIEGDDDLESTGFWDLFEKSKGLIVLEWADKLETDLLPRNWKKILIEFAFENADERKIRVSFS